MALTLLTLPLEVRLIIYYYVFLNLNVKWSRIPICGHTAKCYGRICWYKGIRARRTAILFVSKQCNSEAFSVFRRETRVDITSEIAHVNLKLDSVTITSMPLLHLQKVYLDFDGLYEQEVQNVLQHLSALRVLEIHSSAEADFGFEDDSGETINSMGQLTSAGVKFIQDNSDRICENDDEALDHDKTKWRMVAEHWRAASNRYTLITHTFIYLRWIDSQTSQWEAKTVSARTNVGKEVLTYTIGKEDHTISLPGFATHVDRLLRSEPEPESEV